MRGLAKHKHSFTQFSLNGSYSTKIHTATSSTASLCGVMQCDGRAHCLQLWAEGPSNGSRHCLLFFPGHPTCSPQQPTCPAMHYGYQQWRQPHLDATDPCHVSAGRHVVCSRQVMSLLSRFGVDRPASFSCYSQCCCGSVESLCYYLEIHCILPSKYTRDGHDRVL